MMLNKKNELVSQGLFFHGNLHSCITCKLYLSILLIWQSRNTSESHLQLLVKWVQNMSWFLCLENIWYFTLNFSGKVKFSIYIISLNLKTIRVKILCWLLLSFKIKIPARPVTHFTTLWIIWVVSLTLRRKQKVFLLDVWKNGKQINEELSFKSIVAPAIGDSYQ